MVMMSLVEDHGLYASSCGYCKSKGRTSVAYGLLAHRLTVQDYQDLLDRGWRRSGMYLYKPEMDKTCCPAYTIRLKADSFTACRDQSRVLKRMQRYLDGTFNGVLHNTITAIEEEELFNSMSEHPHLTERKITKGIGETIHAIEGDVGPSAAKKMKKKEKLLETDEVSKAIVSAIETAIKSCISFGKLPAAGDYPEIQVQKARHSLQKLFKNSDGDLKYTTNTAFLIAARLKRMHVHKRLKNIASENNVEELKADEDWTQELSPTIISELLASQLQNCDYLHGLRVKACKGHLNFMSMNPTSEQNNEVASFLNNASEVDQRKPVLPDVDSGQNLATSYVVSTPQKHNLEIRMMRSAFDSEEFALYKKYQIGVHNDKPEDVSESSYVRFLVESPLIFVPPSNNTTPPCGFGSFHQQYLIDGQLVAVGVVDILPSCLSSKYLFWDPDLAFLSLGKYSVLQEIQWVQNSQKYCPSLQYYYLGYYIHSCSKMRYKAAYAPSELLCPVRYQWVPFHVARTLLDEQPYVCLSDYIGETADTTKHLKSLEDGSSSNSEKNQKVVTAKSSEELKAIQDCEIASSSKECEDMGSILLMLRGRYLQFKQLEALRVIPPAYMDRLMNCLRKYLHVVGSALAARIAYYLG